MFPFPIFVLGNNLKVHMTYTSIIVLSLLVLVLDRRGLGRF